MLVAVASADVSPHFRAGLLSQSQRDGEAEACRPDERDAHQGESRRAAAAPLITRRSSGRRVALNVPSPLLPPPPQVEMRVLRSLAEYCIPRFLGFDKILEHEPRIMP